VPWRQTLVAVHNKL